MVYLGSTNAGKSGLTRLVKTTIVHTATTVRTPKMRGLLGPGDRVGLREALASRTREAPPARVCEGRSSPGVRLDVIRLALVASTRWGEARCGLGRGPMDGWRG